MITDDGMTFDELPGEGHVKRGINMDLRFYSATEALDFIENTEPRGPYDASHKTCGGSNPWSGTRGWGEAMELARSGWTAGVADVNAWREKIASIAPEIMGRGEVEVIDMTGDYVDIDLFRSHEMECMVSYDEEVTGAPRVVKIGVELCASSAADPVAMRRRGAALSAMVDAIESHGVRVELWAVSTVQGHKRDHKAYFVQMVRVKDALEPLAMDRVAFWLSNPAGFRRMFFALIERYPRCEWYAREGHNIGMGYGIVASLPAEASAEFDLYLSGDYHGLEGSEANAIEWIKSKMAAVGIAVETH